MSTGGLQKLLILYNEVTVTTAFLESSVMQAYCPELIRDF